MTVYHECRVESTSQRAQTVGLQGSHVSFRNKKTEVNHGELCLGLCLRGNTLWRRKVSNWGKDGIMVAEESLVPSRKASSCVEVQQEEFHVLKPSEAILSFPPKLFIYHLLYPKCGGAAFISSVLPNNPVCGLCLHTHHIHYGREAPPPPTVTKGTKVA